jgi:hypothetical protein
VGIQKNHLTRRRGERVGWTSRKAAQSNNPSIKSVVLRAGKMAPGLRFACPGYLLDCFASLAMTPFWFHAKARSREEELRHSRESGNPVLPKYQTSKPWHRQKRTDYVFANTFFLDSRFRGNDGAKGVFFFAASREKVLWILRLRAE